MSDPLSIITSVIIALLGSGVIGAIVSGLFMRRKVGAEADKTRAETQLIKADTITKLNDQIDEFLARIEDLENRLEEFEESDKIKDKYISLVESERDEFKKANRELSGKVDRLRVYVRRVLDQMKEQGVKYDEPPPGLLDTQELDPK